MVSVIFFIRKPMVEAFGPDNANSANYADSRKLFLILGRNSCGFHLPFIFGDEGRGLRLRQREFARIALIHANYILILGRNSCVLHLSLIFGDEGRGLRPRQREFTRITRIHANYVLLCSKPLGVEVRFYRSGPLLPI